MNKVLTFSKLFVSELRYEVIESKFLTATRYLHIKEKGAQNENKMQLFANCYVFSGSSLSPYI